MKFLRDGRDLGLVCAVLFLGAAFCARVDRKPLEGLQRLSDAPIIAPRGGGWESAGTFNPAVITREGKIVMLYRAQDRQGTSRLGYAESEDGIHFTRRGEPVLSPETPNVVFVEGMIRKRDHVLLYYGAADTNVGVAETRIRR